MYVTDAHGFIWFLAGDKRLGEAAKEIFLSADKGNISIVVPSIVLLETLHICEKQRAELKFKNVLDKICNTLNYPTYPLDTRIVAGCQNLKQIPDFHDRIIIATAKLLGAKLITKDKRIRESELVEVIW